MTARLLACSTLVLFGACRTVRPAWSVAELAPETARATTTGPVVGGAGQAGSHAWLGIPFAAPPVGPLRWRAPQKPAPWTAPFEARRYAQVCPQPDTELAVGAVVDGDELAGSEDCLALNVWAPPFAQGQVPTGEARLPVMVWIHGGGNSIGGAGLYDLGRLAAEQKVLAISVHYRLGPLGWFRLEALRDGAGEDDASGNFGTLDLVAALEWVRDNAAAFGGDPGNVTIFGESAGGENVYSLLLSPRAKGLFHRAIAQSPVLASASLEYAEHFTDDPVPGHANSSQELAARLLVRDGLAKDRAEAKTRLAAMGHTELARYLRGQSASALLLAAQQGPQRALRMLDLPMVFGDGAVLPKASWRDVFATPGGWNQVPVLTGSNRDEAKLFFFFDPRFTWKLFGLLPRIRDEARYQAASEGFSRLWRAWAVDGPVDAMLASGARDVFSYRFDWDEERRFFGTDLKQMLGAGHGLEIPFVLGGFDGPLGRIYGPETLVEREQLSAAMRGYWAQFARTGAPGNGGVAGNPEWPRATAGDGPRFLALDGAPVGITTQRSVETIDAVVTQVLSDERLTQPERCEALSGLVAINFLQRERYDAIEACRAAR
ncbi:MAG: carboxylesterase family protein [Myxococcaceae bacterium]|nr:carboxylesterase family protein [Myxococcaceae bacterium]